MVSSMKFERGEAGGGDEIENAENKILLRQILERLKYVEAYVKSTGSHSATTQAAKRQRGGLAGFRNGVAPTEPSMLAFTHAGGDDEDAPPPTQEEVTEAWLAEADRSRDAEELFMPATWRPDDEKKNEQQQAVVPARCNEAAPQPVGCGTPPFGASQRLMWTVCMLSMFVCVAGALRGTGDLHLAGGMPADVAADLFTDGHGRVWYYPQPVEVTFGMHEIDGWELRLRGAVDVLIAGVRQATIAGDILAILHTLDHVFSTDPKIDSRISSDASEIMTAPLPSKVRKRFVSGATQTPMTVVEYYDLAADAANRAHEFAETQVEIVRALIDNIGKAYPTAEPRNRALLVLSVMKQKIFLLPRNSGMKIPELSVETRGDTRTLWRFYLYSRPPRLVDMYRFTPPPKSPESVEVKAVIQNTQNVRDLAFLLRQDAQVSDRVRMLLFYTDIRCRMFQTLFTRRMRDWVTALSAEPNHEALPTERGRYLEDHCAWSMHNNELYEEVDPVQIQFLMRNAYLIFGGALFLLDPCTCIKKQYEHTKLKVFPDKKETTRHNGIANSLRGITDRCDLLRNMDRTLLKTLCESIVCVTIQTLKYAIYDFNTYRAANIEYAQSFSLMPSLTVILSLHVFTWYSYGFGEAVVEYKDGPKLKDYDLHMLNFFVTICIEELTLFADEQRDELMMGAAEDAVAGVSTAVIRDTSSSSLGIESAVRQEPNEMFDASDDELTTLPAGRRRDEPTTGAAEGEVAGVSTPVVRDPPNLEIVSSVRQKPVKMFDAAFNATRFCEMACPDNFAHADRYKKHADVVI
eukprot:gene7550-8990_t